MSSSSYLPSRSSSTHRRPPQTEDDPIIPGPQRPGLYPAPNPKPIFQFLAFGLVILLGLLQLLPVTHIRDPSNPFRNWVPVSWDSSSTSSDGSSNLMTTSGGDDGMVHVVSWMECLDLRVFSVLVNSTLSASRYPDLVYFHLFFPGGNEDKVSFYKLKVLFPHSNLEVYGQEEVKQVIRTTVSEVEYTKLNFEAIAPYIIRSVHQSLSKFIYVSPNVIVKGRVEELIGVDLSTYAVAAAEDCSKRLNTYVNLDVLDAVQRSASKPWISETPYAKDACIPDLSVLLIDARKLQEDFVEAVLWWTKVLNWSERSSGKNPAIALALYNRYVKLSASWLISDSTSSEINKSMAIHYDGPKIVCSEFGNGVIPQSDHGNVWTQYLPPMSNQILGD